jgi:cyclic peptide transporter
MHDLETARQLENRFQALQNMILDGFKEIFLEPRKGQYLYWHKLRDNARASYRHNTRALTSLVNNQMIGQVLFNGLVTFIVLVCSVGLRLKAADLVAYVFTLLYLSGAIAAVMVMLPTLMRAGVSVNHLTQLRAELETARFTNAPPERYRFREAFDGITVRGLAFRYGAEATAFGIGPVDLRVNRGETVFIYGGNGSGKTTFFNALVGLCTPTAGEIRVDGTAVDAHNYADYRSLFAVVFNDFYLFEELPGFPVVDPVQWQLYLRLFELEGKVTLSEGRFLTTNLSTGQRKRLALILALLEQKPIVALDEWAADQDPYFRRKFYTEILPYLKAQGFTVVAITHDDKYYGCADKLYKMNEGKLAEEAAGTPAFEPVAAWAK